MEKGSSLVSASLNTLPVAPDRVLTKLRYFESLVLDVALGVATYVFRLNSVHDPDFTGTGHQPTGYDQWSSFYQNWRVLRASFHLKLGRDEDSAVPAVINVGVGPAPATTAPTYLAMLLEDPRATWGQISNTGPGIDIRGAYDIRTLFGLSRAQFADVAYQSAVGSNPTNTYYLIIFVELPNGANTVDVSGGILLEYEVEFFNRVNLSPSLNDDKVKTYVHDHPSVWPSLVEAATSSSLLLNSTKEKEKRKEGKKGPQ